MDHSDEKLPNGLRVQLTADAAAPHVRKRNTLRNKMRLWSAKASQATNSTKAAGVGHPKRRPAPSMPILPWTPTED